MLGQAVIVRSFDGLDVRRRLRSLWTLRGQLEKKVLEVTGMSRERLAGHFLKKLVFEAG